MKQKPFLLIIGFLGLIIVIVTIFIVLRRVGSSYNQGLNSILPQTQNESPVVKDKRRIRKIIIDEQEQGCLEVSADGVVRTYDQCGGELLDINRLFDPKRIVELFEYTSRIDPADFRTKPPGNSVRLIIETDTGSVIVYIPVRSGPDSITDVIDLIKGDIPKATPTPGPTLIPTPTLPGTTPIPTNTPTPTFIPGISPTRVPTGTPRPFSCGFNEGTTGRRPYTITNVICSTEPTPNP